MSENQYRHVMLNLPAAGRLGSASGPLEMLTPTGIEIPYKLDPEINPPEPNGQVQGDGKRKGTNINLATSC